MLSPRTLRHAADVLPQVLAFRQPADAVLAAYFREHKQLGRQERQAVADTVFAAIRHRQKIQAALPQADRHPEHTALAAAYFGALAAPEQLASWATEHHAAHLTPRLADTAAQAAQSLNTAAELPAWLIDTLRRDGWHDDAILAFGRSTAQAAPLDLRVNTLKAKRDKVLAQLRAEGLAAEATPYSPWGIRLHDKTDFGRHPLFLDGSIEIQDEGSQLLALVSGAKRNEIVVDFCAGAGGKTLAMGAMMKNSGRLYAFDVAEKRLANLKPRLQRSGLSQIHLQRIEHEQDPRLARLYGKADRVLVDAPCSGLGTLRRNPDLKYRQSPESVAEMAARQARILAAAARLVRPGGTLIYATCSVLAAENETQIERFLAEQPGWQRRPALLPKGDTQMPQTGVYLRPNPAEHQTDGFFAAVLLRQAT